MSTPLYQEALIEAKKLREAAAAEAKNAVLEAVQPLIKQMIDKEISGIILEQEEPPPAPEASADAPPPPPPPPSPDAGSTGPIDAAAPGGAEVKPPMPGMTPAVSAAAPPIKTPGSDVIGKIDIGPAGEQQIVIPVDALFQKETTPAATGTVETPAAVSPPPEEVTPEVMASPEGAPPPPSPSPEAAPGAEPPPPESLAEIYRAVQKLLREQAAPAAPPAAPPADPAAAMPPPAPAADPNAPPPPPAPTGDLNAAAGAPPPPAAPVAPPAAPAAAMPPADPAMAGAAPPAAPPAPPAADPNAAPPPVTPAPAAAGVPAPAAPAAPAPVTEYKNFKTSLDRTEGLVESLRNKSSENVSFLKEAYEKQLFSLYNNLLGLKAKNAISPRLFSFNEDRLGLLYENLNVITSYKQNPLVKGNKMANKNSLKDLVRSLFEGAEGFEDAVGKVDPAGDSEGGSAEHAHRVSGNPKGVKAEAESAPFPTKQKKEWPGKPSPESLLEQLEEEISELMGDMQEEPVGEEENDEVVLELSNNEVMMEARKARARLKALREQAEDKLSLTIDLDGVSGEDVQNVNVSLDGDELDVDMDEEDMGGEDEELDMDMGAEEDMGDEEVEVEEDDEEVEAPEEESSEKALMESRKIVRKAVNETKTLRGQLHETQLLTARSLYVNKLFVRDELTGAQKRKIVEYLDSANTIAEAKEIYNRLVRVLNAGMKNGAMIKESAQRPGRMLTESYVEPSFDTSRWQILAGVKRNAR